MTPEELLKPRFKVIAAYPMAYHKVGFILDFSEYPYHQKLTRNNERDEFGELKTCVTSAPSEVFELYPHLFKKLQWWEERKIEEMPAYVRHNPNGKVRKVSQYLMAMYRMEFEGGRTRYLNEKWLPATQEEYHVVK